MVSALLLLSAVLPAVAPAQFVYQTNGSSLTLTRYTGSSFRVVVPGAVNGLPVSRIGERAFFGCTNMGDILLPESLTQIGDSAFACCSHLWAVRIPRSVQSIGDEAFASCSTLFLAGMDGSSLTSIGKRAFASCPRLTSVTISSWVQSIGKGAFEGCTGLTNVTLGRSVTRIGKKAFPPGCHVTLDLLPNPVVSRLCEQWNGYQTEFTGPRTVNLDQTSVVPLKIRVRAPDGKPYNGPLYVRTDDTGVDGFLGPNGAIGPLTVEAVDGQVEVQFHIRSCRRDLFRVMVFKPPFPPAEPLGETTLLACYVDSYPFLPEQSALCVPADGKSHPTLRMAVKDHAGLPMVGIEAQAFHYIGETPGHRQQQCLTALTDRKGIATFVFPALTVPQYANVQCRVASNYTSQVVFYYQGQDKPKMVDLRQAAARVKGATFEWDRASRTITIKKAEPLGQTVVFKEGTQYVRIGLMVEALEAPVTRKGDTILVPEFAGWQSWVY